jgi:uncharacterized SAM-binding protein YcdF (DUF218 family)
MVIVGGLSAAALAFGFVMFATYVTRDPVSGWDKADGIVVLTGTDDRIQAGARLLNDGRAKRLLISGVNRQTTASDIQRIAKLERNALACCVDLGYEALDTFGNADEAKAWAVKHNFTRLIIVTSSYHMPRSMAELSIAMPERTLLAYPVLPRNFPDSGWWLHGQTTKLLLKEYLKFLPVAARLAAHRTIDWSGSNVVMAEPRTADG